jgi:hypothetical protein
MTTQPENKDKAEQKISKDELGEKELEKAAGGVTFTYGKLETEYHPQKPDGTN